MSNVINIEFMHQENEIVKDISQIVDEMGNIKEQIKILESREKILREQLLQTGEQHLVGEEFVMLIQSSPRKVFDYKKVKDQYGAEWYDSYCNEITVESLRFTRRK